MRLYALRLARTLGYANVDVMLSEMGVSHLREQMALDQIDHEERLRADAAARVEDNINTPRKR